MLLEEQLPEVTPTLTLALTLALARILSLTLALTLLPEARSLRRLCPPLAHVSGRLRTQWPFYHPLGARPMAAAAGQQAAAQQGRVRLLLR